MLKAPPIPAVTRAQFRRVATPATLRRCNVIRVIMQAGIAFPGIRLVGIIAAPGITPKRAMFRNAVPEADQERQNVIQALVQTRAVLAPTARVETMQIFVTEDLPQTDPIVEPEPTPLTSVMADIMQAVAVLEPWLRGYKAANRESMRIPIH